jgi:hypothetical protein
MKTLALAVSFAALLAGAAPASAAAVEPAEGGWTAAAAKARGARATLSFSVAAGTASPVVELRVRRCRGARAWSGTVTLAGTPVGGGRLKARHRGRVGAAQVRLRVEGRFASATAARGTVRGRVALRRRGGGRRVTCKLPKLAWNASLTDPASAEEPTGDEDSVDEDPDASEEESVEDDEWTEEDEDWANEDDWVPEDDEGYVWEDADALR